MFEEINWIPCVEVQVALKKLHELGAEITKIYPHKIEFKWCDKICEYEKGYFDSETGWCISCNNIEQLDKGGLNVLVGKLKDDQLNRVGVLIDLFEDDLHHSESQKEDLEYLEMQETPFYRINNEAIESLEYKLKKLKKSLQTGCLEYFKSHFITDYIFWGK